MRIAAAGDVVSPDAVLDRLRHRYPGLVQTTTWGERTLLYNPGAASSHGVYFVTVKERDSASDAASALDARGAYRVSFAVAPERYRALFGHLPPRVNASDADVDPLAVDRLMPHPLYAWMSWASVVNPSPGTLEELWPLLDESYALVQSAHDQRRAG